MRLKELLRGFYKKLRAFFSNSWSGMCKASSYPSHLIPNSNVKIISQKELENVNNLWLIRHQEENIIYWEGTRTLNPKCIKIDKKQMNDLSNNLLGEFKVEDIFWAINKNSERYKQYNAYWNGEDACGIPSIEECVKNEEKAYYFIPVDHLIATPLPYENLETNYTTVFHYKILHTPTNCNFWHISVRVYDNKGTAISEIYNISKGERIRILRRVRDHLIQRIIKTEVPLTYTIIPKDLYLKGA